MAANLEHVNILVLLENNLKTNLSVHSNVYNIDSTITCNIM